MESKIEPENGEQNTTVDSWKHLWHGAGFFLAGLFMLGSYVAVGDPSLDDSVRVGPLAGMALIGVSLFMVFGGKKFLAQQNLTVEYYEAIVMAVGIALMVRTFVVEPFKIPSGSMIPTLLVGDYLFVSKFTYGHRVPFTRTRVFMGEGPKRGDIAVFEYPKDPRKDYIKRIVGLPGDHIVYRNKRLYLNGEPVGYESKGAYNYLNEQAQKVESVHFNESFKEGIHSILVRPFAYSDPTDTVVPEGHYFAMGDNRDNSNDSRYWGFVPAHRLVGKAVAIFWSWDHHQSSLRIERLGQAVE